MSKPHINVTPLIDVLLVLLIIFMVVTPMKPSAIESRIPSEPDDKRQVDPNPLTLVVTIDTNSTIRIQPGGVSASVQDPNAVIKELRRIFEVRTQNLAFSESSAASSPRIEKTVFIKAPKQMDYGTVAKVIDVVKLSGADPVSLQIDDLQ